MCHRLSPGGRFAWRSGWSAPPQGTGCQAPTHRQRPSPRETAEQQEFKGTFPGTGVCIPGLTAASSAPIWGRLSEGIMQNKAALFPTPPPPPGNPGLGEAFALGGRIRERELPGSLRAEPFSPSPGAGGGGNSQWEAAKGTFSPAPTSASGTPELSG